MIELKNATAHATILPESGGTAASFEIDGKPVLLPVKTSVPRGEWPAGGIPVCFPFAGRVWHDGKLGQYVPGARPGGKTAEMPLHGFGFSRSWHVDSASQSSSQVTLSLTDDDATLARFPWRFTARLTWTLAADALTGRLEITCNSIEDAAGGALMPLAPGFHPYFAARHPVDHQDGFFSFAYDNLDVPALETIAVTAAGNAGAKKLASDMLPVSGGQVRAPAHDEKVHNLIFGGLSGRKVTLGKIELSWTRESPWRHVVCWAKPQQHFFCVEPWFGLPDAVHRHQGVIELKAGASCAFDLTVTGKP